MQLLENPQHVGQHIRKRRVEQNLKQNVVAELFGVSEDSVTGWENGRYLPQIKYYPAIIEFLGYNPFPFNENTLGGKIKKYRYENGLSIKHLAKILKTEERTLTSWEKDIVTPKIAEFQKLKEFIS